MGKYKRAFPPSKGENRDDMWKRVHWDTWTFWRKVRHVIAVIACVIAMIVMVLGTGYVVLIYFGVVGFLEHIRDTILLEFAHWLFDDLWR